MTLAGAETMLAGAEMMLAGAEACPPAAPWLVGATTLPLTVSMYVTVT